MNASAKVLSRRDDYIPQVKAFVPLCDGEELTLRCSILLARDMATKQMQRCSEESYGILAAIAGLASRYAFAAMPIERLEELRYEIVRLVSCASGIEMFAFKLSSPDAEAGGQDARG